MITENGVGGRPLGAEELQALLQSLWMTVLGVTAIEPDADFFDLGGRSLQAVMLVNRLREETGIDLSPVALFDAPTIAGLVALCLGPAEEFVL